jgi:hypothetical protein
VNEILTKLLEAQDYYLTPASYFIGVLGTGEKLKAVTEECENCKTLQEVPIEMKMCIF